MKRTAYCPFCQAMTPHLIFSVGATCLECRQEHHLAVEPGSNHDAPPQEAK